MHRHFARRKQVQQTTSPVTFKVTVPLWFLCPSGPSRVHLYVPELQLVVFRIFREYSPSLGASKGPSCSIWWWFCTSILSSPFSVSCSKKESLNHTLLTDPQALSLHTNVLPLVFTKPTSTDVWKQFIVWMCDLWGPGGGGNQWQFFKALFVLELHQDCILWSFIPHPLPYMKERVLLLTLMMCWPWWSDEMGKSLWIKFCCWLFYIKCPLVFFSYQLTHRLTLIFVSQPSIWKHS